MGGGGSDDDGAWATPVFRQDFRHSVDLSAFLSPTRHIPSEDPPPYSEQLLEGHITLMHGGQREAHKDDSTIPNEQDPMDSTLLTVRDVSLLNSSTQSAGFSTYLEGDYHTPSAAGEEIARHAYGDTSVEYADSTAEVHSDSNYAVHSSTPARPITLRGNDPFIGSHNMSTITVAPPPFQRPYRSFSLDSSNVPILVDSGLHRDHPTANAVRPFPLPPRLLPINLQANSVQAMHETASNPPFPARPTRLPPLQGNSVVEMASQHRKRNKRRRGHSWHGEAMNITTGSLAVSPTTMTTVAEY